MKAIGAELSPLCQVLDPLGTGPGRCVEFWLSSGCSSFVENSGVS